MRYDTIVIGSGIGGMAAAVALARAGHRVLVLEQHYLPGGWTHSFSLNGYTFSPGVHYVGELAAGGGLRRLLEGLGLGRQLAFWELNPDGFDHVLIGDQKLDIPKGIERYVDRLEARFPNQRQGLRRYFDTCARIVDDLERAEEHLSFPRALALPFRAPSLIRWGMSTLSDLLNRAITDPLLRGVLAARCGNHGLAPSRVSLPLHASMIRHYYNGAYYPRGGARKITSACIRELRRNGGEIRVRTRVASILVDSGRATGVELATGERLYADNVISNADAALTYERLLPEPYARWHRRRARRMQPSVACLSVFAATDLDLSALGYDSGNYWWYRTSGVGRIYERMERAMPDPEVDALFISVSSLKDPRRRPGGDHTLEMFTFVPYEPFRRWAGTESGARSEEYQAFKRALTDRILATAENVIPGLRRHITFCELGTPLTNDHYCATRRGGCYGTAKTPWQVGPFAFGTRAPVERLYLCGASTLSHGIGGAAISGLFAARSILGLSSVEECLGPADGALRVQSAEGHPIEQRRRTAGERGEKERSLRSGAALHVGVDLAP